MNGDINLMGMVSTGDRKICSGALSPSPPHTRHSGARPALAGREPGISAWESLVSAKHFEIPGSRSAGFAGDARPGMTSAGQ